MVCGRCGRPLGGGAGRRWRFPGSRGGRRGTRPSLALALLALLGLGALLTAAVEGWAPGQPRGPILLPSPDRPDPEAKRSVIMLRNIAS